MEKQFSKSLVGYLAQLGAISIIVILGIGVARAIAPELFSTTTTAQNKNNVVLNYYVEGQVTGIYQVSYDGDKLSVDRISSDRMLHLSTEGCGSDFLLAEFISPDEVFSLSLLVDGDSAIVVAFEQDVEQIRLILPKEAITFWDGFCTIRR